MSSLQALAACAVISLMVSAVLFLAISRPLRAFIERMCPATEAVNFWLRFTLVMLFLSPLFVAVAFGLPPADQIRSLEVGELIQRATTSALVGVFLAMIGIGLWVASLARKTPSLPPRPAGNPNEFWGDKSN